MLRKGDLVADFSALNQHGERLELNTLLAEGPLVLYFYPKAMTPG